MSIPGDDYERQCRGEISGLTGKESHIELAKYHLEAAQSALDEVNYDDETIAAITEALDLLYAASVTNGSRSNHAL
ncbi:hypothetical protein [Gluconobacter kondonii]|uniref:hypothetical protein n=1 Tax=Gluconobacter kondonii TaxID=941463 RepID=UPI001B8C139D|nr:hypothetical protein [Gluconobacter kondonii]MBS1083954.1 hypothetical protein [Gluconobacter kondonii]